MLRGQLHLFKENNDKKFTIIELLFTDGYGLAMTDFQGQATPTLNPIPREAEDTKIRIIKTGARKTYYTDEQIKFEV